MTKILRYNFLVVLFVSTVFTYSRTPLKIDSTRVTPIEVTEETESGIFGDKAYIYKKEEAKRGRNFIKDIVDWFRRDKIEDEREREDRENSDPDYDDDPTHINTPRNFWDSRTVGNFLIMLCIIAVVGGLVYLLVTGRFKKVFSPKPVEMSFDFKEITEDIEGMNIEKLIAAAQLKGDYRLATRWWYLKILKKLTMENLIAWKPHKTNFDYYRELEKSKYIQEFRSASHIYEYVWYGEMPVNEEIYNKYTPRLDEFEKSIHA